MKLIRKSKYFSVLFLLIFSLISCRKPDDQVHKQEITIGVLLPETGSGASPGESCKIALMIAQDEINTYLDQSGSSYKLLIETEDTQTDTTLALQHLKVFFQKGINLVIGPYSSAEVQACKGFADKNGIILLSPSSVSASLAIAGDNIFRFVPSDLSQGEAMNAMLQADSMEVILPVVRNDIWGSDLLQATAGQFINAGGTLAETIMYDPALLDIPSLISTIKTRLNNALALHPADKTGIYLISFGEGTEIINAVANDPSIQKVKWYGSSAFANNSTLIQQPTAAQYAVDQHFSCPIFGLDETAAGIWQPLTEKIRAKIGRTPEIYALAAYDALWVAVFTCLTTGMPADIKSLKNSLPVQAGRYFGATGRTLLNEAGDRASANYDFWGIRKLPGGSMENYEWYRVAAYNTATKVLSMF